MEKKKVLIVHDNEDTPLLLSEMRPPKEKAQTHGQWPIGHPSPQM